MLRFSDLLAVFGYSAFMDYRPDSTMKETTEARPRSVIGPDGQRLTRDDLPPANTRRWVIRRKAEVVAAVRGDLLSLDEACDYYNLSHEEFECWRKTIDRHGIQGLRTTRIKKYRPHQL